jgi:hypothetical protein
VTALLALLLRGAGVGLIALALAHIAIARRLNWRDEARRMSPANASIFHVHTFFVCVGLVLMGLPALLAPQIFVARTPAGAWITWSIAAFWALRLCVQWFVYPTSLWRGKRLETVLHVVFSIVWIGLTALFTACGLVQTGRLS